MITWELSTVQYTIQVLQRELPCWSNKSSHAGMKIDEELIKKWWLFSRFYFSCVVVVRSSFSSFFFLCFASSQLLFHPSIPSLSLSHSVSVSHWNNNRSNHRGNTLNSCDEGGLTILLRLERENNELRMCVCAFLPFIFFSRFSFLSSSSSSSLHIPDDTSFSIENNNQ